MLLGDLPVPGAGRAWEMAGWYRRRWGIEEWHRVVRTGCNAEAREFKTAGNLTRVLAFDLIVAWRILACARLGRTMPQLPAGVLYTRDELQVLRAAQKNGLKPGRLTLAQANRLVAQPGGCAGRRGDGEPGAQSLGNGLRRLMDMAKGWRLHRQAGEADQTQPQEDAQFCV
jgi:hypothetical protein